jgi:hypothetical protein
MADFFKWANDNPAATQLLIFALWVFVVAFALAVFLCMWAFVKDRPITLFGFKLPESKVLFETGRIALPAQKNPELWDESISSREPVLRLSPRGLPRNSRNGRTS